MPHAPSQGNMRTDEFYTHKGHLYFRRGTKIMNLRTYVGIGAQLLPCLPERREIFLFNVTKLPPRKVPSCYNLWNINEQFLGLSLFEMWAHLFSGEINL